MRYYEFALNTTSEKIRENASIKIREYDYQCVISAVNNYMYTKLDNDVCFLAYREEANTVFAIFAYAEKKILYKNAFMHILEILHDAFRVEKVRTEPTEITMFQFFDCLQEAKRRSYYNFWTKFVEAAKLQFYNFYDNGVKSYHFDLKEKIIPEKVKFEDQLYDESLIRELSNIEVHKNPSDFEGNMVHYIISGRSVEAASCMTEALMQKLVEANRLKSRRMEIISDIEPDIYEKKSYLEEIIENNYGGAVVIDLSEKFGFDPVDYGMACKYIEKLVKTYRNDCLFVFTYNTEKPGYAYRLLPMVQKHVIPVMLREGTGDRKAATGYLKNLIRSSKYRKYSGQAGEFMKLFPGNEFSQTDVLLAFEKFEPWCLNRNIFKAYDYQISDDFMLDRDEDDGSSYDKLKQMIGLVQVKKQIDDIIATDIVERERKRQQGNSYESRPMHMIFSGNPGTAKTTVAKLFAGIAKEKGILKSGAFVERGGMDLDGLGYVSEIRDSFEAAKGGVLFIDEAYSLKSDTAVTVLIQEMENWRDEVIVILAGYNNRMRAFMKINEGLKSRVPNWVDFPDYTTDELVDIFKLMLGNRRFSATEDVINIARNIFDKVRLMDNFGNGRYVRNLIDRAIQNQSVRLLSAKGSVEEIKKKELFSLTGDDISTLEDGLTAGRKEGTAKKELDEMIGLVHAKAVINKAVASFKVKKFCVDNGISRDKPSMHMVFTGNPGTAKTSVARLFAEILKDEKVLPSGTFVEVGRADLVGDHVGATAPLVRKKFKEAQGGVLFIDEAYSLCDSYKNGYGDEAINTIVQEMENHRDNVIVIFAGYPEPMKEFLERNPGMSSRVAFQVEFEDYTTDELCDITRLMLSRKQMAITDAAMEKLRKIYEKARGEADYGNGRFVRKMLEEAEMNLAERVVRLGESGFTAQTVTTIVEQDIQEPDEKKRTDKKMIGFCVA